MDYSASNEASEAEIEQVKRKLAEGSNLSLCCPRFAEAHKSGEVVYAYSNSTNIDETSWFIPGLWHLYFCPFCGENIKGIGFGDYDTAK